MQHMIHSLASKLAKHGGVHDNRSSTDTKQQTIDGSKKLIPGIYLGPGQQTPCTDQRKEQEKKAHTHANKHTAVDNSCRQHLARHSRLSKLQQMPGRLLTPSAFASETSSAPSPRGRVIYLWPQLLSPPPALSTTYIVPISTRYTQVELHLHTHVGQKRPEKYGHYEYNIINRAIKNTAPPLPKPRSSRSIPTHNHRRRRRHLTLFQREWSFGLASSALRNASAALS